MLSPESEISVLTIGKGVYLYDSFGHSAFRVNDKKNGIDLIFNYGSFDFNTPYFFFKFARGKLPYKIVANYFDDFYKNYVFQNRTIKEQFLNLNQIEKQQLFEYLQFNLQPENKYYKYDFFYDNCATKIRDVLEIVLKEDVDFKENHITERKTFRELIQDNLHWNTWGSTGIDLALGSIIDESANAREHMFLPNYIFISFENAIVHNSEPLVKQSKTLFQGVKKEQNLLSIIFSPFVFVTLISLCILLITYFDFKKQKHSKWLDVIIFIITGLFGVIMLLLWFATDHSATAFNFNLLWAFFLNIFFVFQIKKDKQKKWFISYIKLLIIFLCLIVILWIMRVHIFAYAIIPLLIALAVRYFFLVFVFNLKGN